MSPRKNLFIVRVLHIHGSTARGHCLKSKLMKSYVLWDKLGRNAHISHCSKPRKWSRPPVWKANILSDKRPCQRLTSIPRPSILTIQAIHRTFGKIGFIAFSSQSNTCEISVGEIPIWTLRQLLGGFIGRFPRHCKMGRTKKGHQLENCEADVWKSQCGRSGSAHFYEGMLVYHRRWEIRDRRQPSFIPSKAESRV